MCDNVVTSRHNHSGEFALCVEVIEEKRYDSNVCSYTSDWSVVVMSVSATHASDAKQHLVTFIQGHGLSNDWIIKTRASGLIWR